MPPPLPHTRFLSYHTPTAALPTAVRQTAARWLRIAAFICTACVVSLAVALLVCLFLLPPDDRTVAAFFLSIPAVIALAAAIVFAACASPVLRASAIPCYAASAVVMGLQLFLMVALTAAIVRLILPYAENASPWNYLFLLPTLLFLLAIGLLSDLSTLLQWIPRHPDAETSLAPFLPRLPKP